MTDVVDTVLGGGAPSPEPGQLPGAPTGPEGDQPASRDDQRAPRADRRIQELVAEREALKQQYFEETGQLKRELEDLKSKIDSSSAHNDRPVKSWSDLSDTQLRDLMKDSADNPDMQVAAMEELARRVADQKLSEFRESHDKTQAAQAYRQQVYQSIVRDFGQDAADKSSDLFRRADAHYAQLRAAYRQIHGQQGDELLEKNPEAEYACFAKAAKEIWEPEREELGRLRGEVERFKQVGSMAIGRSAGVRPPDAVQEALKKGDWKSAIRKLPIIPS